MLKNTGERLILENSWNLMTTMEHLHRYNAVEPLISGKTVLDAACGSGYGTFQLSKSAKLAYGIDISEDAVEYAQEHFQNNNLKYEVMSVTQINFEDNTFDVITSFETIEHITKDMQLAFLQQIKKKLKKDGILIMSTPNDQLLRDISYGSYVNEFHLCEFTEEEYIRLLKQYFKHVRIYYQTVTQVSAIVPKKKAAGYGRIYSMEHDNHMGRYYIAVCSDSPVENLDTMESAFLPILEDYFDEAYFTKNSMLFIDKGNGFCDEDKIVGSHVSHDERQFKYHFSLKEYAGIKALRFDPCEHGGQIRITKAITNRGLITLGPANAEKQENGFDVFQTLDPQYITSDTETLNGIDYITIYGEMRVVPDHLIITDYEMDKNELSRQKHCISELTAQIEKLNSTIIVQKEINEKVTAENKEIIHEISCQKEQCSLLADKNNELLDTISALEEKNTKTEQIIIEKNYQITQLMEQFLNLEHTLEEIHNSKSWKLTTPFRYLHKVIKKKNYE